jgi:hypothetical protein
MASGKVLVEGQVPGANVRGFLAVIICRRFIKLNNK